jgi:hypothetical protein
VAIKSDAAQAPAHERDGEQVARRAQSLQHGDDELVGKRREQVVVVEALAHAHGARQRHTAQHSLCRACFARWRNHGFPPKYPKRF